MFETEKIDRQTFRLQIEWSLGKRKPSVKNCTAFLDRVEIPSVQSKAVSVPVLPLREVLCQIGVKPFSAESVEGYKKAMVRKRFQIWEKEPPSDTYPSIMLGGLVLNVIAFGWMGREISDILSLDFSLWYLCFLPIVCFILVGILVAVGLGEESGSPTRTSITLLFLTFGSTLVPLFVFGPSELEWKAVSLKEHKKEIPREVLDGIDEIRMRCPEARFFIDELGKKPDPFLIVVLGEESYHIDVWLESSFEAKCLV